MKTIKSLVLGSAAGLLAVGGAQAADLPVKAKAVEYVKVCSLYGPGFFYIPGTDTCMKIGGSLRIETTFNGVVYDAPAIYNGGNTAYQNRTSDYYNDRARMQLTVDTRTATEYGVVRTFGLLDWDFNEIGGASASSTGAENLFLQFAGFTFGKSASAFASPWHSYPGNTAINVFGGGDSVVGINNIQYTAQFGGGVSATIGLDSASQAFNRTAIGNLSAPAPGATVGVNGGVPAVFPGTALALSGIGNVVNAYGGQNAPDVVGNVRVDQAWGLFQLSGALHDNHASYYGTTETSGHPADKWGGAVMAALQIKNIPWGAGDDIKMDATYTVGATHYMTGISQATDLFMFKGSSVAGAYQSLGFATITDSTFVNGGDQQLTTAYGFRGAYNHNWDPHWSTSLFGGIGWIRYNGTAQANYCAAYAAQTGTTAQLNAAGGYTCNPNSVVSEVGLVTRWTPVNNLTFFFETVYTQIDQNFSGVATLSNAALGGMKPTANYSFKDQGAVSADIRVQRNF